MSLLTQQESIAQVQRGIRSAIEQRFPFSVPKSDLTVQVSNVQFKEPDDSYAAQQKAFDTDLSMQTRVTATVSVMKDGRTIGKPMPNVLLGTIPHLTQRGTYIQKGNEMVLVNHMYLRPGIYVHRVKPKSQSEVVESEVRTGKVRFIISYDRARHSLTVQNLVMEFGRKTKPGTVNALSLLHILGATDDEIRQAIGDDALFQEIKSSGLGQSSLEKIYGATHATAFPGKEEAEEKIRGFFERDLAFNDAAQEVNKVTMGEGFSKFDKDAFLRALKQLFAEEKNPGTAPNVDDMRFKGVATGEDLIVEGFTQGLEQWMRGRLTNITEEFDRDYIKPNDVINKAVSARTRTNESGMAEAADLPNPLALFQAKQKLTVLGGRGLTIDTATNENRNLQDTAFAKIDPIETPQSLGMGLIQHLAKDAKVQNGRITSSFYRVRGGAVDRSKVIDNLDPLQEFDEYVAFNNPETIDRSGSTWRLKGQVRARHRGDFVTVDASKITLIDKSPSSVLGYAAALIPFGAHNDGARMLMGANMQSQAMALEKAEAPLVQSYADHDGKTIEEEVADKASFLLRAKVDGKVKAITPNAIEIVDKKGNVHKEDKLNYFAAGKAGGYINHQPVVSVGDEVKKGDLLADGWQSKNGQLALGRNALVAYMPFDGFNFEDGVGVSETFANNMASEEIKTVEYTFPSDMMVGSRETRKLIGQLYPNTAVLAKLDDDGVIKKGEKISAGDLLVAAVREKKEADVSDIERIWNALGKGKMNTGSTHDRYEWEGISKFAEGYMKGKIIDVRKVPQADGFKVIIKMLAFKPMEIGDKLAGRHGNKATISAIFPDSQMPRMSDGRTIDVVISPLAVPSRKNIGQLLEVNAGQVAEKKGLSVYKVHNFDREARKKLEQEMREVGLGDGKVELINPATGKPYESKVTAGPAYIMKLKHKVENKITARSYGGSDAAEIDKVLQAPKKVAGSIDGERHNPQGVGGMEFWSLTSAGAVHNVHEMTTLKSDGAGDKKARFDIYKALYYGTKIKDPVTPGSLRALQDLLYGAGLQMTPLNGDKEVSWDDHYNALSLQPMNATTRERLKPTEVKMARGLEVSKDRPSPGGFHDPEIFGKDGDKWGAVTLTIPMANPLFLNKNGPYPYAAMLGYKGIPQSKIIDVVKNGKFIVLDPKDSGLKRYDVIDLKKYHELEDQNKEFVAETGSRALGALLKDVDLKEAFRHAEGQLKDPKAKLKQRSDAEKSVRVLANALDRGLKPDDFLMHYVPVLPEKYRPLIRTSERNYMEDGLSKLYTKLSAQNKMLQKTEESGAANFGVDPKVDSEGQQQLYQWLEHTVGVGDPYRDKTRGKDSQWLGVLHRVHAKPGILRSDMQKKMQDYSGRSVISVDPTLNLDEVGLPEDMAVELFKPFVRRELDNMRFEPDVIEKILKDPSKKQYQREFRKALENAVSGKTVILNRQPSLHRHSMQAFKPQIRWNGDDRRNMTIGLNPLVTTGFNADFDGDTMPVHLPLTKDAQNEANDKLLPSKNLLNPTNNQLIMELKHEMQLGIYYMTRNQQPKNFPAKKYRELKDLVAAYNKGEVGTYDAVEMNVPPFGIKVATAGQHMFNLCLPAASRDYVNNLDVNDKKLTALLTEIIQSTNKGLGPTAAVETMNKLRNLSFRVSTFSGLSIGAQDFQNITAYSENNRDQLFAEAAEKLKKDNPEKYVSGLKDAELALEQEKTREAQSILEKLIKADEKEGGLLSNDNPVKVMMHSGARGKAGQINSMAGIIGVGRDVTNQFGRPIAVSHLEGLTPDQFWDLAYDSRKGIFDKSIATRDPGALTREIWMANKQTVISEEDCGDKTGIVLDMSRTANREALRGRVLLTPVPLKDGDTVRVTGKPVSISDFEKIKTNAVQSGNVRVRSPLSCKAKTGICRLCYGARAGAMQNELAPIGEAVGSIAAQALGEPSQQAIMKTFHTGAGSSGTSDAFAQLKDILLAAKKPSKAVGAVLVERDGIVTKIVPNALGEQTVYVDKKPYPLGKKPLADGIVVGGKVEAGDALTKIKEYENGMPVYHTVLDPRDVLRFKGKEAAQQFLVESLEDALKLGGNDNTDHRHIEVVVSNMTNRGQVTSGGTSHFLPGRTVNTGIAGGINREMSTTRAQVVALDFIHRPNVIGAQAALPYSDASGRIIVKRGETITETMWDQLVKRYKNIKVIPAPIHTTTDIIGMAQSHDAKNDDNWLGNAGFRSARHTLGAAAAFGSIDRLSNPLTRQMAGLKGNFSSGFEAWKNKLSDLTNGFL